VIREPAGFFSRRRSASGATGETPPCRPMSPERQPMAFPREIC